jgi:hypothetical protein
MSADELIKQFELAIDMSFKKTMRQMNLDRWIRLGSIKVLAANAPKADPEAQFAQLFVLISEAPDYQQKIEAYKDKIMVELINLDMAGYEANRPAIFQQAIKDWQPVYDRIMNLKAFL